MSCIYKQDWDDRSVGGSVGRCTVPGAEKGEQSQWIRGMQKMIRDDVFQNTTHKIESVNIGYQAGSFENVCGCLL